MNAGRIVGLFRPDIKGKPRIALSRAEIVTDQGLVGDRYGKPESKRQVLLMDMALVERFGLQPGELDENLTVAGLPLDGLRRGQQVRIGSVLLELTIPCPVCDKVDSIRAGLRDQLRDERGIFARVVHGGTVVIGDAITVLPQSAGADAPSRKE